MSIKELMESKQSRALEEIRAALWTDNPNEEEISDIALSAGIEPEQIATLQDKIETAKAKIKAVEKVDLTEMKAELADARKKLQGADRKLTKAKDARTAAAREVDRLGGVMTAAQNELTLTARILADADAPPELVPDVVKQVQGVAIAQSEFTAAEQAERVARNSAMALKGQVDVLRIRRDALSGRDRQAGNAAHSIIGGRLVPTSEPMKGVVERAESEAERGAEAHEEAKVRTKAARAALEAAKAEQA